MIESRNDQSVSLANPVFELDLSAPTPARRSALSRLFQRIGEISTIPSAALRLTQLPADEDAQAKQLREIVESDPALAARVLRRVSSSFYGLRCRVADYLCARYHACSLGVMNTPCPGEQLFAKLGLDARDLDPLVDELAIQWREAESLAQL
ncbi:MAG: HDOD domain-containing protein [Planctomycetes bacterium]|nr:HDOD domain-containing protein [Planctomycetota bacterium]